jgi:EAL domain-containing protein (putative c-di-GMP-specific phosphodiesterase class I)
VNLTAELERTRATRVAIEALIADPRLLGPDFQPIRRLADDVVIAQKATGRGAPGTVVGDTLSLLEGASSVGLVERLDWAWRCHTFDVAMEAGLDVELHLTPEPATYGVPCPPRLAVSFGRGRRELSIVAELHDDAFGDLGLLRRAVEEMRGWGWRLAVVDLADEDSIVGALPWLRPEYVQVDLSRPGRATARSTQAWISAARSIDAQVMALGVDGPRQQDEANALRADCGRGAALGKPRPTPAED